MCYLWILVGVNSSSINGLIADQSYDCQHAETGRWLAKQDPLPEQLEGLRLQARGGKAKPELPASLTNHLSVTAQASYLYPVATYKDDNFDHQR